MNMSQKHVIIQHLLARGILHSYQIPAKYDAEEFVQCLVDFMFPAGGFKTEQCRWAHLSDNYCKLISLLRRLLKSSMDVTDSRIEDMMDIALEQIPDIFDMLVKDAEAILHNDPAAVNIAEVVSAYPGFRAIVVYRFAHVLSNLGLVVLPRLLTEVAHGQTGIDIHPNAVIGTSLSIDHGTGIVIGETCELGDNVKLFQGVTLGAKYVDKSLANQKRHPTIESDVTIYANATILGGDTVIGQGSVIGGNTWIVKSIPPYSQVYYQGKNLLKESTPVYR